MIYNKNNFHKNTFCIFHQVDSIEIKDLIPSYKSKSGSHYYFTEKGVFRKSNHWGRAANCRWRVIPNQQYKNQTIIVAYANWSDFYRNNDLEKLFYIILSNNQPILCHKDSLGYDNQFLMNAKESAKRIKEIKKIIDHDEWTKYFLLENINDTKNLLIELLTNSSLNIHQIKNKILNQK